MSVLGPGRPHAKRELVVVVKENVHALDVQGAHGAQPLQKVVEGFSAQIRPLAGSASVLSQGGAGQRLSRYFFVAAPDRDIERIRETLGRHPDVESAYVKPAGEPPSVMSATPHAASGATPDFSQRQIYLGPSPEGVDARYAWSLPGGKGAGMNVIDCEWGWNFSHEDLQGSRGLILGTLDPDHAEHGSAVMGVLVGNDNATGINGICPAASFAGAAFADDQPTSATILQAGAFLRSGDVLLLEIHRPGPRTPNPQQGQKGLIAIEWWPDDFEAIRQLTDRGVIVVEAAGNGWEDLDHPAYDQPAQGFPSSWRNPFRDSQANSGAVLVGAGNPPRGTHGRDAFQAGPFNEEYVDRARCVFSNFGARVDCQGWGWEVTTAGESPLPGLGDLFVTQDPNRKYMDIFAGTSSASPIVAGVLVCAQAILKNAGRPLLTPARARELLRATGAPQTSAPGRPATQRIGTRPDMRALLRQCGVS